MLHNYHTPCQYQVNKPLRLKIFRLQNLMDKQIVTYNKSLYDIVQQAHDIESQIIEAGGEITKEIEASFENMELVLADKVDAYAHVMDEMKDRASAWKGRAQVLDRIQKSLTKVHDVLKGRIKEAMTTLDKDEMFGDDYRFKLSKSKGKLVITDALPDMWKTVVTTYVPDKERILHALKLGREVTGARIETSTTLRRYANTKGKS